MANLSKIKKKSAKQKRLERKFWLIFFGIKLVILILAIITFYLFSKRFLR